MKDPKAGLLYCCQVNQTKSQHILGVALLKVFGLDSIHIRREKDGHYVFEGWTIPPTHHNGSGKVTRRGVLTVK